MGVLAFASEPLVLWQVVQRAANTLAPFTALPKPPPLDELLLDELELELLELEDEELLELELLELELLGNPFDVVIRIPDTVASLTDAVKFRVNFPSLTTMP